MSRSHLTFHFHLFPFSPTPNYALYTNISLSYALDKNLKHEAPQYIALFGQLFDITRHKHLFPDIFRTFQHSHHIDVTRYMALSGIAPQPHSSLHNFPQPFTSPTTPLTVEDLPPEALKLAEAWLVHFRLKYKFLGVLAGPFFTTAGTPTVLLLRLKSLVRRIHLYDSTRLVLDSPTTPVHNQAPKCEASWMENTGSIFWCKQTAHRTTIALFDQLSYEARVDLKLSGKAQEYLQAKAAKEQQQQQQQSHSKDGSNPNQSDTQGTRGTSEDAVMDGIHQSKVFDRKNRGDLRSARFKSGGHGQGEGEPVVKSGTTAQQNQRGANNSPGSGGDNHDDGPAEGSAERDSDSFGDFFELIGKEELDQLYDQPSLPILYPRRVLLATFTKAQIVSEIVQALVKRTQFTQLDEVSLGLMSKFIVNRLINTQGKMDESCLCLTARQIDFIHYTEYLYDRHRMTGSGSNGLDAIHPSTDIALFLHQFLENSHSLPDSLIMSYPLTIPTTTSSSHASPSHTATSSPSSAHFSQHQQQQPDNFLYDHNVKRLEKTVTEMLVEVLPLTTLYKERHTRNFDPHSNNPINASSHSRHFSHHHAPSSSLHATKDDTMTVKLQGERSKLFGLFVSSHSASTLATDESLPPPDPGSQTPPPEDNTETTSPPTIRNPLFPYKPTPVPTLVRSSVLHSNSIYSTPSALSTTPVHASALPPYQYSTANPPQTDSQLYRDANGDLIQQRSAQREQNADLPWNEQQSSRTRDSAETQMRSALPRVSTLPPQLSQQWYELYGAHRFQVSQLDSVAGTSVSTFSTLSSPLHLAEHTVPDSLRLSASPAAPNIFDTPLIQHTRSPHSEHVIFSRSPPLHPSASSHATPQSAHPHSQQDNNSNPTATRPALPVSTKYPKKDLTVTTTFSAPFRNTFGLAYYANDHASDDNGPLGPEGGTVEVVTKTMTIQPTSNVKVLAWQELHRHTALQNHPLNATTTHPNRFPKKRGPSQTHSLTTAHSPAISSTSSTPVSPTHLHELHYHSPLINTPTTTTHQPLGNHPHSTPQLSQAALNVWKTYGLDGNVYMQHGQVVDPVAMVSPSPSLFNTFGTTSSQHHQRPHSATASVGTNTTQPSIENPLHPETIQLIKLKSYDSCDPFSMVCSV